MCFFCILFSSINDEKLRRKYCNKQITSRDNGNVQSHDQEESKLISIIHTNSPTNTPRGFHISTWNPRGVFVGSGANTLTHDKVIKRSFNKDNLAIATIKSKYNYNSKDILLT